MRIFRILLQSYRVFEDPLELEFPSGLVGVYGSNGAGKSYLIESIPWTLYGRSRTSVQDVRTSGSDKECVTEIEFEHDDHLYRVRRSVSVRGLVRARGWIDNDLVCDGVKETNRFVHATLGMDIDGFRSSVFAEQKQLSAFSDANPADRQRLVLSLLGITPLDKARDMARSDARLQMDQLKLARASLPDIGRFIAEREEFLEETHKAKSDFQKSLERLNELSRRAEAEENELKRLDAVKIHSDQIIAVGKEKRRLFDELAEQVAKLSFAQGRLNEIEVDLLALAGADREVGELEVKASEIKALLDMTIQMEKSSAELRSLLDQFGCQSVEELRHMSEVIWDRLEESESSRQTVLAEIRTVELDLAYLKANCKSAEDAMAMLESLGSDSPCPTCGQQLGEEFEDHLSESRINLDAQTSLLCSKEPELLGLKSRLESFESMRCELILEKESVEGAIIRASILSEAIDGLNPSGSVMELRLGLEKAMCDLKQARGAQARSLGLLAEKHELDRTLQSESRILRAYKDVECELQELKLRLNELDFDFERYRRQAKVVATCQREAQHAKELHDSEIVRQVQLAGKLERVDALIDQVRESHAVVGRLEVRSELVGRVADYLNEFRRSTISALGPRLAAASASLFAELTESDYDRLEVDTSNWQLRISDYGSAHDLGRFSGSERDLANLAFRIAISEQIGHSFGQQVGLLVLDEIFGPLDDQRKFVMLGALDSLKARFNQVIVVTHGTEIKEQMPGAIEVVKVGRRRATARVA
ncbi:MAG: SMC family ATPase [Actinomycetota bacterium]|nr:SMC family ATPase [Actinomycetota bacterium]